MQYNKQNIQRIQNQRAQLSLQSRQNAQQPFQQQYPLPQHIQMSQFPIDQTSQITSTDMSIHTPYQQTQSHLKTPKLNTQTNPSLISNESLQQQMIRNDISQVPNQYGYQNNVPQGGQLTTEQYYQAPQNPQMLQQNLQGNGWQVQTPMQGQGQYQMNYAKPEQAGGQYPQTTLKDDQLNTILLSGPIQSRSMTDVWALVLFVLNFLCFLSLGIVGFATCNPFDIIDQLNKAKGKVSYTINKLYFRFSPTIIQKILWLLKDQKYENEKESQFLKNLFPHNLLKKQFDSSEFAEKQIKEIQLFQFKDGVSRFSIYISDNNPIPLRFKCLWVLSISQSYILSTGSVSITFNVAEFFDGLPASAAAFGITFVVGILIAVVFAIIFLFYLFFAYKMYKKLPALDQVAKMAYQFTTEMAGQYCLTFTFLFIFLLEFIFYLFAILFLCSKYVATPTGVDIDPTYKSLAYVFTWNFFWLCNTTMQLYKFCISYMCCQWYFGRANQVTVIECLKLGFNHLGSLAFQSLLVFLLYYVIELIKNIEKQFSRIALVCISNLIKRCRKPLEKLISSLTTIRIAHSGSNFCESSRDMLKQIINDPFYFLFVIWGADVVSGLLSFFTFVLGFGLGIYILIAMKVSGLAILFGIVVTYVIASQTTDLFVQNFQMVLYSIGAYYNLCENLFQKDSQSVKSQRFFIMRDKISAATALTDLKVKDLA